MKMWSKVATVSGVAAVGTKKDKARGTSPYKSRACVELGLMS